MLFIVINGVFAFLFLKPPFCTQFLLVIYFLWDKYQKRLRKVIKYAKNIHKVP